MVSICLPTFNSIRFLVARLDSILSQTYDDWELIVFDSGSNDGTVEMITALEAVDSRVRMFHAPRDGIYPNFNRGIRQASGDFIHIATSDDTMPPDFLNKMVNALEKNHDCELAHCPMRVLSEDGSDGYDWWRDSSLFATSCGSLVHRLHKRVAPLDGVLCLLGDNVYSSVTQILSRRTLFDKIGLYEDAWGSLGDFHWNLRAGLVASSIHVPDTWGGWRMHPDQATASVQFGSSGHQRLIDQMIDDVLVRLDCFVEIKDQINIIGRFSPMAQELKLYLRGYRKSSSLLRQPAYMLRQSLAGNTLAWRHLISILSCRSGWIKHAPLQVVSWFEDEVLIPLA